MIKVIEAWLIEGIKGVGRFFLNPLLYWVILLVVFTGYRRIKQERMNFGYKVFDIFSEWKHTLPLSIGFGLFISLITIGLGIVLSIETIIVLSIIVILLSFRFSMLSPSYTIGLTYVLLLFAPFLFKEYTWLTEVNFQALAILLSLFLFAEASLLHRMKRSETFPTLTMGERGLWIGEHHLKKLAVIPFFTLVPAGMITPFAPFWPYFSIGDESYRLLFVPFIIGFDYVARGNRPDREAGILAKANFILAMIVIVAASMSIIVPWASLLAVIIALFGHEWMKYRNKVRNEEEQPYFHPTDHGLKILGIIPNTPADRLDFQIGETITKVNGLHVSTVKDFYYALQNSGSFFKIAVLDERGEVRFVQSAFYEGDHHKLGFIFTAPPYHQKQKIQIEKHPCI